METEPAPHSDMPFPPTSTGSVRTGSESRRDELLLAAIRTAVSILSEHRLFRAGKFNGLFPSRAGLSAEAAQIALREGYLETTRTEVRGKIVVEWVKGTPRGIGFVHDRDSPVSVLRELLVLLESTRSGVPVWMDDARRELADLSARFESRASAALARLENLTQRIEAALRRSEAAKTDVAESVRGVVPWAVAVLEYLDNRQKAGLSGSCVLPELFRAAREHSPEIGLIAFQDGLRRLHDIRAIRLKPRDEMPEPEHAIVVEGQLVYSASRE